MPEPRAARSLAAAFASFASFAALAAFSAAPARADDVSPLCRDRPADCGRDVVVWIREPRPNPARHGLELGVEVGLAHPAGSLGHGSVATTPTLSDLAETAMPFTLDAGYRLTPLVFVGGSVDWAPAFGNDAGYCAACGFRYDVQALATVKLYAFPERIVSPWISYGVGWEVFHVPFASSADATYQGPVAGDLKVGVDLRRGAVSVGPYVGATAAAFVARTLDPSPRQEPAPSVAFHGWFAVGLHGSYAR